MSPSQPLRSSHRRDLLAALLDLDAGIRVETARDGFLFLRFPDGLGVRFHYYPYPLISPSLSVEGLQVASLVDLGLMKLGAIISRRSRRDFVDLYFICQRVSLDDLLEASRNKFRHVRDFPLQALKALADRHLSEDEAMPLLKDPVSWNTISEFCESEVIQKGRRGFGLQPSSERVR